MIRTFRFSLAATALFSGLLLANQASAEAAVYGDLGMLGMGGGVAWGTNDFSVRLSMSKGTIDNSGDDDEESLDENLELKFGGTKAILDWYPFAGSFRLSGGLINNTTQFEGSGQLSDEDTLDLNDTEYGADVISGYTAELSFKKTAPYLGIGWGNPVSSDGRFTFVTDLGVLLQGSPEFNAGVTCVADAETCAEVEENLAVETKDIEDSEMSVFPYFSLGLAFRFL